LLFREIAGKEQSLFCVIKLVTKGTNGSIKFLLLLISIKKETNNNDEK